MIIDAGEIDGAWPAECDGHLVTMLHHVVLDRLWPLERDPFEFAMVAGSHLDPGCRSDREVDLLATGPMGTRVASGRGAFERGRVLLCCGL